MELKTDAAPVLDALQIDAATFELARAAGLSVCTSAQSTFNRQVARFTAAIRKPLQAEIDALRLEVAQLRQVRASIQTPPVPQGCIEYEYCAGTSEWGNSGSTSLVCHLEYEPALPATAIEPAEPASVRLIAAYHRGVNVLDTLVGLNTETCIEELALADAQR